MRTKSNNPFSLVVFLLVNIALLPRSELTRYMLEIAIWTSNCIYATGSHDQHQDERISFYAFSDIDRCIHTCSQTAHDQDMDGRQMSSLVMRR